MIVNHHIIAAIIIGCIYILGFMSAIDVLMSNRKSQSIIAWVIPCITFPYLAVPIYWMVGRRRFEGYIFSRRSSNRKFCQLRKTLRHMSSDNIYLDDDLRQSYKLFEKLAAMPFTRGNRVDLLIDGDKSFDSIFEHIAEAKDYILIQFFIVRSDAVGQRFLEELSKRARAGVRVYFLYDQLGSFLLHRKYINALRKNGINVMSFRSKHKPPARLQVNFRNHRKMVIVDGRWAVTGGVNVGEEYCGHTQKFGYWRDTMVSVSGPAVQEMQLSYAEDWFYLCEDVIDLNHDAHCQKDADKPVLVLPTGPADDMHTCSMMVTQAIQAAEKRFWISSPYFVPDNEIIRALQLAALRGVDVRILLPNKPDHLMVYWASFTYLRELADTGVRFYRYTKGFLHQKVMLVDNKLAMIGTVNADNRSFYLNFELTMIIADKAFAGKVHAMLKTDFYNASLSEVDELSSKSLPFRILARLSRLFAPIL